MSTALRALAGILLLLVAGCVLPREQADSYRAAFAEARNAGLLLLDKISPAVASLEPASTRRANCGLNFQGYYRCFDPTQALGGPEATDPPGIAARRLALETVATYNDLLIDVIEGKVVDRANAKIGELTVLVEQLFNVARVASTLSPVLVQATPALQAFAGSLRGAIASFGVRRALVDGAPLVHRILDALAADTPRMFAIYSEYRAPAIIRLDTDIRIAQVSRTSTTAALQQLQQQRTDVVTDINTFHDSLAAYVVVLDKTGIALDALSQAASQPVRNVSDVTNVLATATEVRSRATDFWNIVRKLN